jgi:hypothetical protein
MVKNQNGTQPTKTQTQTKINGRFVTRGTFQENHKMAAPNQQCFHAVKLKT